MIESWLEQNFDTLLARDGQEIRINCPFCAGGDTDHHLYVNVYDAPVAHCFKCEWRGNHYQLLMQCGMFETARDVFDVLEGRGTPDVGEFSSLADRLSLTDKLLDTPQDLEMPDWFVPFKYGGKLDTHAGMVFRYACNRMDLSDILAYGVGYCKDTTHPAAFRLILPVERGFWQGRSISSNSRAKYLSTSSPKGDVLFNAGALDSQGTLYIAEGILSAIALGPKALAILGKRATRGQIKRMLARAQAREVIIALDAGEAYSPGTIELAKAFANIGAQVKIRNYAFGDPDNYTEYTDIPFTDRYEIEAALSF